MCNRRSWSGPTGQPARYVDGRSGAVMAATVPVKRGAALATGGFVVVGAFVVVETGGVVVVEVDVVVAMSVDVVIEGERCTAAAWGEDDPHAPLVRSISTTNAPARKRGCTTS